MEQKQRVFIYDRREVIILILLGLAVAIFAFTLGVHLGKKVTGRTAAETTASEVAQVPTLQDSVPNKQELTEQSKNTQAVGNDELTQTLHDEVTKSGIKLKTPKQVELPTETKSKNGGATTLEHSARTKLPADLYSKLVARSQGAAAGAKFTLQVGSFPTEEEAKVQVDSLRSQGLKPVLRAAQVKGLGTRFRLFVGAFPTRNEAEAAGKDYQSKHVISSFLVSKSGE